MGAVPPRPDRLADTHRPTAEQASSAALRCCRQWEAMPSHCGRRFRRGATARSVGLAGDSEPAVCTVAVAVGSAPAARRWRCWAASVAAAISTNIQQTARSSGKDPVETAPKFQCIHSF